MVFFVTPPDKRGVGTHSRMSGASQSMQNSAQSLVPNSSNQGAASVSQQQSRLSTLSKNSSLRVSIGGLSELRPGDSKNSASSSTNLGPAPSRSSLGGSKSSLGNSVFGGMAQSRTLTSKRNSFGTASGLGHNSVNSFRKSLTNNDNLLSLGGRRVVAKGARSSLGGGDSQEPEDKENTTKVTSSAITEENANATGATSFSNSQPTNDVNTIAITESSIRSELSERIQTLLGPRYGHLWQDDLLDKLLKDVQEQRFEDCESAANSNFLIQLLQEDPALVKAKVPVKNMFCNFVLHELFFRMCLKALCAPGCCFR